jgi:branched-chain amino acid transport system substrate-binding protein
MSQRRRRALIPIASGAILFLALAACGGGGNSSTGTGGNAKPLTIQIGSIGPETGSASANFVDNQAMAAYFAMVNAHGGINGHQVDVHLADDQNNPANTGGALRGLVDEDKISMTCDLQGTPQVTAVRPYMTLNKIPDVAPGATLIPATGGATNSYTFTVDPTYQQAAALLVQYAVQKLHKLRIGIVYSPNTAGLAALSGTKWELQQLGVGTLVGTATYQVPPTSMSTQAAAMKASNADFVINWDSPATMGLLQNSSAQIGFNPTFGGAWFAAGETLDQLTKGAFDNNQYYMTWLPIPTDPSWDVIKTQLAKYAPSLTVDNGHVLTGWISGDVCAQALEKATAGGKSLTSAGLLAALNSLSVNDQFLQGLNWTAGSHSGVTEGRIVEQVTGGVLKAVTATQKLPPAPFD